MRFNPFELKCIIAHNYLDWIDTKSNSKKESILSDLNKLAVYYQVKCKRVAKIDNKLALKSFLGSGSVVDSINLIYSTL